MFAELTMACYVMLAASMLPLSHKTCSMRQKLPPPAHLWDHVLDGLMTLVVGLVPQGVTPGIAIQVFLCRPCATPQVMEALLAVIQTGVSKPCAHVFTPLLPPLPPLLLIPVPLHLVPLLHSLLLLLPVLLPKVSDSIPGVIKLKYNYPWNICFKDLLVCIQHSI